MFYKIMNGVQKNWLEEFLGKRNFSINDVNGTHLYHYNLKNDEYEQLQKLLQNCTDLLYRKEISFTELTKKLPYYSPLFVLYASYWWQKNYDGSNFTWDNIFESLKFDISKSYSVERSLITQNGFQFWNLPLVDNSKKFLGTISREAGLPQKIITESMGSIGTKLISIIREVAEYDSHIVEGLLESKKNLFSNLYQNDVTFGLIKETIIEIIKIRQKISSNTAREAIKELNTSYPNWKSVFPFSLDDDNAIKFFENLLGEAIQTKNKKEKQEQFEVIRTITKNLAGYNLQLSIKFPTKIPCLALFSSEDCPQSIMATCECDKLAFSHKYLLDQNIKSYTNFQKKEYIINNPQALEETRIAYSSKTGDYYGSSAILLNSLDKELPWVFEKRLSDNQDKYFFISQGGANSTCDEVLIALPNGYNLFSDTHSNAIGSLNGVERELYLVQGIVHISNSENQFIVKTNSHRMSSQVVLPCSTKFFEFLSSSYKIITAASYDKFQFQDVLWKGNQDSEYKRISSTSYGVGTIWIKNTTDNNIKEKVILLPKEADIKISKDDIKVSIKFINWNLTAAIIDNNQSNFVIGDTSSLDESYEIIVHEKEFTGDDIPEYIHLHLFWHDYKESAEIFIPYPREGISLFDPLRKKVHNNETLCVTDLYGYKLMLYNSVTRRNCYKFLITLDNNKYLYELANTNKSITTIRLQDWEDDFNLLLSSKSNLDAKLQLQIINNGSLCREKWNCCSYFTGFKFENGLVYLEDISKFSSNELEEMEIEAFCLSTPEEDTIQLQQLTTENTAKGVWQVSNNLPYNGPWLLYKKGDSSIRPKLWYELNQKEYKNKHQFDMLQKAIEANDREKAFSECIPIMANDFNCPEWETFYALTQKLGSLRLSTLDIWLSFIKNTRIMACLVLNSKTDYREEFMQKIEDELPFLWQIIPLSDWIFAFNQLKLKYNEEILQLLFFNKDHPQELLQKYIAPYLVLQQIIFNDPISANQMQYISTAGLFNGENSSIQDLFRRHENDEWISLFEELIQNLRNDKFLLNFLPSYQGYKDSVICLPIILAIQNYTHKPYLFEDLNSEIVLRIRNYRDFDPIWFDEAYYITLIKCAKGNIKLEE